MSKKVFQISWFESNNKCIKLIIQEAAFQFPKSIEQQNSTTNHSSERRKNSPTATVIGPTKKNNRTRDASRQ